MPLAPDPEVAAAMAPIVAARRQAPVPACGDWRARREAAEAFLPTLFEQLPADGGVTRTDRRAGDVPLRWYEPPERYSTATMLYLHGGGMIFGTVDVYDRVIASLVAASGVPALAVDYRRAPEHPFPGPVDDCVAGLEYLAEHAQELGFDRDRLAVVGDSAGGNLAAAVTRLAHERGGPAVARQLLIYPMLDDRTTTTPATLEGLLGWSADDNVTGWTALLGDDAGGDATPWAAAPARAMSVADLDGLPPTYLEVGELDLFRDETVAYATALWSAGVPTELHVRPGCPHGFDVYAPHSDVAHRALADRVRVLRSV